jgi:hypothetical protein
MNEMEVTVFGTVKKIVRKDWKKEKGSEVIAELNSKIRREQEA